MFSDGDRHQLWNSRIVRRPTVCPSAIISGVCGVAEALSTSSFVNREWSSTKLEAQLTWSILSARPETSPRPTPCLRRHDWRSRAKGL